ncbi:MAG: GEVED domain-containing protein [Pseudomonadota bacterium]
MQKSHNFLVVSACISQVFTSSVSAVDTSMYGAWDDILTPAEAVGRFQWLERCYRGLLLETWDNMYDSTALVAPEEKIQQLRNAWLYENGNLKTNPNYLTLGNEDHQNPRNWYAGKQANDTCKSIPSDYRFTGLLTSYPTQTYCAIKSIDTEWEWIAEVKVDQTFSTSQSSDYTFFSGRFFQMPQGQNISVSVTPGFKNDEAYPEYITIWADWNRDGDFADQGELVASAFSHDGGTVTQTIQVPQSANPGLSRMRVTLDWLGSASVQPCRNVTGGEVEDYSILIK